MHSVLALIVEFQLIQQNEEMVAFMANYAISIG